MSCAMYIFQARFTLRQPLNRLHLLVGKCAGDIRQLTHVVYVLVGGRPPTE